MYRHLAILALAVGSQAFRPSLPAAPAAARTTRGPAVPLLGRRDASAAGLLAVLSPLAAVASGGATSGRTTSIPRAKLRYYSRITATVLAFQSLSEVIGTDGQKNAGKAFFSDSDEAPYTDLKTAGYLLAVAFKLDSKIPPDKLQTVKDYKLMMKDLDKLKAAMGGKPEEAKKAYAATKASLNVYLEGVELPPLGDKKYAPE